MIQLEIIDIVFEIILSLGLRDSLKRARRHGHRGSVSTRHMRQGVRPCAGVAQERLPPSQHYYRQLGQAADV